MTEENQAVELYRKHRPTKFSEVVGQTEAVRMLQDFGKRGKVPHCLLFTGPSGIGKTSLARILVTKLHCSNADFVEVNAAKERGIDMVRDIERRMGLAPMSGSCRVWLVDEAHQLTADAQSGFLKILEDTPVHVYFMLATTDPQKLKRTIITRSTELKLKALSDKVLSGLLDRIVKAEEAELSESVRDKIIDVSQGSARKALVLLHSIIGMEDEDDQLRTVEAGDSSRDAIEIARALLNPKVKWTDMTKILKEIEGLDAQAEGIRFLILSYMSSVALSNPRMASSACRVIEIFRDNFYDTKRAGLIAGCYELTSDR